MRTKTSRDDATDSASVSALLLSMADTTWRMFIPPLLVVPAGLWLDRRWVTAPWLTLVATMVGLSLSIVLVRRQLKRVGS